MNKIAVITVIYNNYQIFDDFINSFLRQSDNSYHIFVVDVSDKKKNLNSKGNFSVITSVNKGYAYAVNLGLKKALEEKFTKFIVINNDVVVDWQFISKAKKSLSKTPSTIIGPKIYYYKGYEYHKNRYSKSQQGKVIWYAGGKVDWKNVYVVHIGVDEYDKGQFNRYTKTQFVSGCCMCFDMYVLNKVGWWDEGYFLYYEDADWCQRAKKKGIELYFDPNMILWHKNAQSTGGPGSSLHIKLQNKARLRFSLKYAPLNTKIHVAIKYFMDLLWL